MFRRVLVASASIGLVAVPVSMIAERFLPARLVAYLDSQIAKEVSSFEALTLALLLLFIGLVIWNFVQLYKFRPSSRPIAIALTVIGLLVYFLIGPIIEPPISRIFSDVSTILWGAVIAMMYCKPYQQLFWKKTAEG